MNQSEKKEVIAQIDAIREQKGLSVSDACKNLGVHPQTYYRFKRGGQNTNGKKPRAKRTTRTPSVVDRDVVLNALYRHVDFKTFQAVESNWT